VSKQDKPLTVRRLKEIMNEIPDDMITDALVLVEYRNREYAIVRTGQFHVVANLVFDIKLNEYGLVAHQPSNIREEKK
jgi:hypothetical protein